MRIILKLIIAIYLVLISNAPIYALSASDIYKSSANSVMVLTVETKDGNVGVGTAFIVLKPNLAVTALHVVRNAKSVKAKFIDGQECVVTGIVDKDESKDIAIIKLKNASDRSLLTFSSSTPEVGSKAYIIGNPFGLEFTISDGIISQLRIEDGVKYYQFTCPASPGNSGGPIFNENGEVLGVVDWQFTRGQNLNFAVPSTDILKLDASLKVQSWKSIKETPDPEIQGNNEENNNSGNDTSELDENIIKACMCISDAKRLYYYHYNQILNGQRKYAGGVPEDIYELMVLIDTYRKTIRSLKIKNYRHSLMTSLFNSLNSTYSQLNYFSKSLYQAQNSRKWSHRAIDYLQKSVAYAEADTISAESMLAEMKDAPEFRNVSDILNKEFDYYASGNVIHIQAYTLYSSNLFIAAAEKDGIGYKMGIREGDTLIAFNDEQLTDFYRFLSLLQDNQCSHASITVKRDGKTLVIKTKIPDFNPVTN